ncbi:MAG TPA: hypothetical protein PLI68_03030 [Bacteroidia bacterium]|nr:hypothetical protein [Bacteroidia bacterium]
MKKSLLDLKLNNLSQLEKKSIVGGKTSNSGRDEYSRNSSTGRDEFSRTTSTGRDEFSRTTSTGRDE